MTKATVLIEENHNLIYSYLHKMRLDIEEYYDLAAMRDIAERLHVSQASISRMLAFIKEKVYE